MQLLYCLQVYKGDEKIKNFIWDLITPTEDGEVQKISRDHSGLHNLVPRGRNAKGMVKDTNTHSNCTDVVNARTHAQTRKFNKTEIVILVCTLSQAEMGCSLNILMGE